MIRTFARTMLPLVVAAASLLSAEASAKEDNFMMLSAYDLAPYNTDYIETVIPALARHNVAGVLYATLGHEEKRYLTTGGRWGLENELAYNSQLLDLAKQNNARIWLQVRLYDNAAGFYAEDINSFNIQPIVQSYASKMDDCRIILFEEASIYHKPQGGGNFWSGQHLAHAPSQGPVNDSLFVNNMSALFPELKKQIRAIDPSCAVGIHIGHSPIYRELNGQSLIKASVVAMPPELRPDFIYYDLYARVVGDNQRFEQLLKNRLTRLIADLGLPVYYLGQLHTTNFFQNGGKQAPLVTDLHTSTRIARESGAAGIGFYTKNTHASENLARFGNKNTNQKVRSGLHEPQKTVFESSKARFDYGLQMIGEQRDRLDLVVTGKGLSRTGFVQSGYYGKPPIEGRGKTRLWIQHHSGQWHAFGRIGPTEEKLLFVHDHVTQTYIVRGIPRDEYVSNNSIRLRFQSTGASRVQLDSLHAIPQSDITQFKSVAELNLAVTASNAVGTTYQIQVAPDRTTDVRLSVSGSTNSGTSSNLPCIDSDGDGWGWDGSATCIP